MNSSERCEWCGERFDELSVVIHPWRKYHHSGPVQEETWAVCHNCKGELVCHLKETIDHGLPSAGRYTVLALAVIFGPMAVSYTVLRMVGVAPLPSLSFGIPVAFGVTGVLCYRLLRPHPIWVNFGKPSRTPLGTPLREAVAVSRGVALLAGIGLPVLAAITVALRGLPF